VTVNNVSSSPSPTFTVGNNVVSSVTPASGLPGSQVQISGSGFGATQGSSSVVFNIWTGTVNSWSDSLITATVPSSASTGPVKVFVGGVVSNATVNFNVIPISIIGVSPSSGAPGTQVTITGSGFGATQGTSTFSFNGTTASVVSWSDTSLTVTVPATATTGRVYATVGGVSGSFVNPYRYTARDYDSETGLQYSRARYFDSQTGRFLSEDPLGFDAAINFYGYVGNNPARSSDPLGLFATGNDKQPWDYRVIIHDLLIGSSKCADWFRKGKCSAVDVIDNAPIKFYTLNENINQPGQTPDDPFSAIQINTNGAFYSESPFAVGHEGPKRDPVYYSGTFGARMVILMHELAHKIGLPNGEFPDDGIDVAQSEKNTLKIIQLCRDAIKDIAKKWHETYSEIPK
jgi:RHS repeat-associated protein